MIGDTDAVGEECPPPATAIGFAQRESIVGLAALTYIASRVVVALTAKAVTWMKPGSGVNQLLGSWDGGWYQWIAKDGYPDHVLAESGAIGNRWAFPPGLPACIRIVHQLTGLSFGSSGLVVSSVAGLVAVIGLVKLFEPHLGADGALIGISLICWFPSAYVLSMIYTESLFIAAAAWCLWSIGRRHWLIGGVAASVGCLVRNTGLVLVATVVVVAVLAVARERNWRALAAIVIAPIGQIAWLLIQRQKSGSFTASVDAQRLWYNKFVWFRTPFESLWRVLTQRSAWGDAQEVMAAGALVFMALSIGLAVRAVRTGHCQVPLEWWLYSVGVVLVALSPNWPSSVLRYSLPAFPLYAVAWYRAPRGVLVVMLATFSGVMATLGFAAFLGAIDFRTAPFAP